MLGPFCTQILGEMGADVIKIEPPGGDIGRWTGVAKTRGMSAAYMMKGRNKRSVVLNLKKEEARKPLRRLVESADVFVHNIRPEAAARLGMITKPFLDGRRTSSTQPPPVMASLARLSTNQLMTI